jgi:uncharacterized protein
MSTALTPPTPAASAPPRIVALDGLRGFAVAGIVLMNVLFFTMPSAAYYNPRAWGGMDAVNLAVWTGHFLLIEDKFRVLFAMLFGASMLLMLRRAPLEQHYARMAVLLLIGLAHAVLLANNDILRLYALLGIMLPLFARFAVRGLWITALLLLAVHMLVGGYVAAAWAAHHYAVAGNPAFDQSALGQVEAIFGADPAALREQVARMTGPYGDLVSRRLASISASLISAMIIAPVTLASMLAGMALYTSGFLTGQAGERVYRRAAMIGFGIGVPALAVLAYWNFTSGFAAVIVAGNALVWSAPFDLLIGIGWAGGFMLWFTRRDAGWWRERLAAAGRMALSNYLGTSLILGTVFFSFGFGLFGQVSRVGAMLSALLPIAAMLLWSPPWLARYHYGPAEWLWRSLSRLSPQPFRKAAP